MGEYDWAAASRAGWSAPGPVPRMSHSPAALLVLVLAPSAHAAPQVVESWTHALAPAKLENVTFRHNDAYLDAAGSATACGGRANTFGGGGDVPHVLRVASNGAVAWTAHPVASGGTTGLNHVLPTADGGAIVCGGSSALVGFGQYSSNSFLARLDSSGQVVWAEEHGALAIGASEAVWGAANGAEGDVWLVGHVTVSGQRDMQVLRYSSAGVLELELVFDGGASQLDGAHAIAPTADGGAYVAGRAGLVGANNGAFTTARIAAAGNVAWIRNVSDGISTAEAVAVDATGAAYVAGVVVDGGVGRFALLKYTPDGTLAWQRFGDDGTPEAGAALDVAVDAFGDVVVAGRAAGPRALVRKYAPNGDLVWSHGPLAFATSASRVELDGAGNVYATGSGENTDSLELALDRDGNARWSTTHPGAYWNSNAVALLPGADGTVRSVVNVGADVGAYPQSSAHVIRLDETAVPTCFGDGSTTACPCGNASPSAERAGCANSFGAYGRLDAHGASSLANDTLVLEGEGMTNASALYIQGDGVGAPPVFGDGLRCATGNVVRLGTRTNVAGASSWPSVGDPSVSVRGGVAAPGVRTYQVWYRNSANFCTPAGFNLTNGLRVTWTP